MGIRRKNDMSRRRHRHGRGRKDAERKFEWRRLRAVGALALSAVVIVAMASVVWRIRHTGSDGPRVVLFVLDTVRRDALGCYGNPMRPTPNLDALAADGVRFDSAVSTSGWTLPSVASILTGTWPAIHGARGKGVTLTPIRSELATAAEVMREHNLSTMAIANAAFVSPMLGIDRGFDVFDHDYAYNRSSRRADATVDAALKLVDRHRSDSFFMMVHLFDAHLDYDPPPPYDSRFTGDRSYPAAPLSMAACLDMQEAGGGAPASNDIEYVKNVYQGEVAFLDEHIGRFIHHLQQAGLYDDAMIVVTADHGEEFWEHGGFEHGHTLYDELVLVPLIVKFPQSVTRETPVVRSQVRLIDVMPTAFDLLGIAAPESFIGETLMPLVTGAAEDDRPAFSEGTLYGPSKIAWRTAPYKYVLDVSPDGDGRGELFDIRSDPGEAEELSDTLPDIASRMRTELLDFYNPLLLRARHMSQPKRVDMSPEHIEKLKSLGYIR